jgi:hypothetical protein
VAGVGCKWGGGYYGLAAHERGQHFVPMAKV